MAMKSSSLPFFLKSFFLLAAAAQGAEAIELECSPEIDSEKVEAIVNESLKGQPLDVQELESFSVCFKRQGKNEPVYGCNVRKPVLLQSVTKLYFVDFLKSDSKKESIPLDFGYTRCGDEMKISGTGYPTISLSRIRKNHAAMDRVEKLKQRSSLCYESSDVPWLSVPDCVREDGMSVYGKLANNPFNSSLKSLYEKCVVDYLEKNQIQVCRNDCGKAVRQEPHFVGHVLESVLQNSDSYFIQKLGALKQGGKTLAERFQERTHFPSVDGNYSVKSTCEKTVRLPLLENCDVNSLPDLTDENFTWKTFCRSDLAGGVICGKTGSSPVAGVTNFAGCKKVKGESISFGIFYDFKKTYLHQEDLDPLRAALYSKKGIWSALVRPEEGIELMLRRLGSQMDLKETESEPPPFLVAREKLFQDIRQNGVKQGKDSSMVLSLKFTNDELQLRVDQELYVGERNLRITDSLKPRYRMTYLSNGETVTRYFYRKN
jgi:hypothetical protein